MQNRYHQLILSIIALFTIVQLLILYVFGYTPYPDSEGYIFLAKECVASNQPYPIVEKLNDYPFLWNIGAINMVAISLKLFHSIIPLLCLYSLMKGISAWLFYSITNHITNERTAFIALILYLIYPANYGESTSTLSELPFMFFILLGLYLAIVRNWTITGGMMLAIANWFRPMAILFLIALIFYNIYQWRNHLKLILGYIVIIGIIGGACYQRTGLFLYQAKTGWMALTDYSTQHSTESMQVREHQEWNVIQKDSAWQSIFFDWLKDHPMEYIQQIPTKLVNTYASDNINMCAFIPDKQHKEYMYDEVSMGTLMRVFPHCSAVQWLTLLNLALYYLLLFTALLSLFRFCSATHLLPVSIIVLGTLLLLFFGHGEARFHIPFIPFYIMLSALFINETTRKK